MADQNDFMEPFYIFIGGAYAMDYWKSDTVTEDQWVDWKAGELVIIQVQGDKVYEPTDKGQWKELAFKRIQES